jgi:hypothetical protein
MLHLQLPSDRKDLRSMGSLGLGKISREETARAGSTLVKRGEAGNPDFWERLTKVPEL